jgi:hypothetical protein
MTVRSSAGSAETHAPPESAVKLGPELQAHIGRQLRSLYDAVLKEPVPDRLHDLLQRLGQKPPDQS